MNLNNYKITDMKEEDVLEVYNISKENFSSEAWSVNSIKYELISKFAVTKILKNDKDYILAFINANCVMGECYINNIAVRDGYKNIGIGSILLNDFIKSRKEKNDEFITLEVRSKNIIGQNFYKKFHFKEISIRKMFYTNPSDDAILMTLVL